MAANSKSDLPSCSPDRLTYPSGHRGAYTSASLSGSYRESMENRILSSLPNMSRSTTTVVPGDVLNFFHGLPFDSKQLVRGHKLSRQGDLNRVMTATLGISAGDLSSGSLNTKHLVASSFDELKRVKTSLHDNSVRARNRLKMLNETTSKFDKCFQNILPRKRSRSDVPSSDRDNSLLVDRTVFGGPAKMGTQSQASAFDIETPKLEEKTKNIVPSKRTRTSLLDVQMDVRANALGRSHGSMERDREMLGLVSGVQSEEKERTLVNSLDSWEKSRMKKKRSGIKSEYSTSTVLNRPLDGDQESKRDMQQRLGTDVRSRSSIHGIRSGPSNGVGKLNIKTGLGMRSTLKNNQDNGSDLNDRRDHIVGSDKERVNIKALNRSNIRENSYSSPSTKANTVTRAPRSGAGAIPKASANSSRSTGVADEWELSNLNKLPTAAGANNRKRTLPALSSSPPVAQWAGQRPQKIPRVARRSNSVRPIVGHDETPTLDTVSHTSGNDNGLGIQRRSSGNGLQQVKLKGDLTSSAALSESEDSGAAEIKSKDKSRKSVEVDEKGGLNIPKVATQLMPSRKNKEIDDEIGQGSGVRRQGRTLRGFSNSRSGNPLSVEKRNHAVTAKQLRSARLSFDKNESKTGRPPSRKLSDRRAYTRPRPSVNAGAPDFHGESDDGHEELLVAANAAINSGHACSSSFWRQIEPIFSFVSAEDISYLKQQGDSVLTPTYSAAGGDDSTTVGEGFGLTLYEGVDKFTSEQLQEHSGKRVPSPPSLCQRLLSAFIVEEEDENFSGRGQGDFELDGYASNVELNCDSWNQQLLGNIQTVGRPASNGYRIQATRRYLDELENDDLSCADVMEDTNVEAIANYSNSLNGIQPDQAQMPSIACTQSQYNQMSFDERLRLEVQSIGIFPDLMSDDEELSAEISRLEEKLHGEVSMKTQLLRKLEKSVTEAKKIQERDIERRAFDKLIEMAYEKYMICWGPNASCGKGISGKAAKQDALAFIKRTLERSHKFKSTSESCFNEAVFMDVFHSVSSLMKNAEFISKKDGESFKLDADTPNRLSEGTDSAPLGSHPVSSLKSESGQNMDSHEKYSSDDFQSANQLSEQVTGKEDTGSNRMKRRELLLDDVIGGNVGTSLRAPSGIGSSLLSGAKGKRSERDREGKGHNRETQFRNGTAKAGRPFLGNAKGERKSKAKTKQRTTQLSASINGLVGEILELPKEVPPFIQESRELTTNRNPTKNKSLCLDTLPDPEALDLSHLQLPDSLGVPDELGEQGQDLASWLNIDLGEQGPDLSDDGFQDNDFMGLQIPMDDLSDLNMMV